jgi:endonuclease/exonuclease/phosphatase family metal-dependent hydrolase
VRRLLCAAVAASAVVLASSVAAVPARAAETFVVLQMNLCNSGMATTCFSGRSVDEAVEKIRRYPPDLVTLQEVCRNDVYARGGWGKLAEAMADVHGSERISVAFVPIVNRYTDDAYRCVNGEEYGVALLSRGSGHEVHRGRYDSQDSTDELRVWACTTVVQHRLTGCTTHLSTDPDVATRQCHELMSLLASPWVMPEVIVAGDFNLISAPGKPYNAQNCVPANYARRSDDAVQQVFFSRGIQWIQGRYESMRWTDHPLLYQKFRI